MQESFWWWQCSVRYIASLFAYLCDLSPRYYLFGDNSALNTFNRPESALKQLALE